MHSPLRHLLPFGLVRASQIASELTRLGVASPWPRALRKSTPLRLQELNLNLLPDGALRDMDCLVDVGANVGDWTSEVLEFCSPRRTFCVEADPNLHAGLQRRFAANPAVTILPVAVGAAEGRAEFTLMKESVFNSLRTPSQNLATKYSAAEIKQVVQVEVRPLDALIPSDARIRLLKIDVQGFEREVLAGARATLGRTECVLLEANFQPHYEGEASFFELDRIMQEHGFGLARYSQPKGGHRTALYADVLYLRKDG